jgi:hypothetical protein
MKNLQKLTGLLVCGLFVLFINACDSQDKMDETGTGPEKSEMKAGLMVTDETTLNLCYNVLSLDSADQGVQNAYQWILANNGHSPLQRLEEKLLKQHLNDLRDSIRAKHTHTTCIGYVTGLQVLPALENDNLRLLYLPMYMCKASVASDSFNVTTFTSDTLYYTADGFNSANDDELNWIRNYRNNIRFKESGTLTRPFNNEMDSTGDTRAVMLTFQGIDAVLEQNTSDTLKIWNLAFKIPGAPAANSIRQSLLLGPDSLTPQHLTALRKKKVSGKLFLIGSFTGKFADRSHLCPPSCDIVLMTASTSTNDCQSR